MARAFDDLKIDVKESLEGPSAFAYGSDAACTSRKNRHPNAPEE